MEICVLCDKEFQDSDYAISLERGRVIDNGNGGQRFCRYEHVEVHWDCVVGLREALRKASVADST